MGKAIIYLIGILLISYIVTAINYDYIYNPYTAKQDRSISLNQSGDNVTADYFFGLANNSDKLDGIDSTQFLRSDINDTLEAYYLYPNGTNPISLNHLVNKEFVELAVAGLEIDYFFTNATSDISGYYVLNNTVRGFNQTTVESFSLSSGNDQLIFNFSTTAGLPFIFLSEGIYDAHIHLDKTGGAAQTILPRWTLSKRNSSGEFLIMTSETGNTEVTTDEQIFNLHSVFNQDVPIVNTDRLVFKLFVDITGGGSSTVRLYMEGTTNSHFTFRTPSSVLQEIFIRRDGRNELTNNWNAGSYTITTNEFSGQQNWTDNQNYPAACPGSGSTQTYISLLNDSTTCTGITSLNGSNIQDIYLLTAGDTTPDGANFTFDDTDNVLFIDSTNNMVGIGTSTPSHKLNVVGDANITGTIYSNDTITKRPWVDVRAFGADGSDTADDSIAIQSAIDFLGNNCGTVFFPSGDFYISNTLNITNGGCSLIGSGIDATTLRMSNSINKDMIHLHVDVNDEFFTLRDMMLVGNKANNNLGRGLYTGAGDATIRDVQINNVFFNGFPETAIHLESAWGAIIDGVVIEFGLGDGIRISSSTDAKITNSKIIDNQGSAINAKADSDGVTHLGIYNNYLKIGNESPAILLNASWSTVSNNKIVEGGDSVNSTGIKIIQDNNIISNNAFTGSTQMKYGIWLTSTAKNNIIFGNIIGDSTITLETIRDDSGNWNAIIGKEEVDRPAIIIDSGHSRGVRLEPSATGDVILFDNKNFTTSGKKLKLWRKTNTTNNLMEMFFDSAGDLRFVVNESMRIDATEGQLWLQYSAEGDIRLFGNPTSGENPYLVQAGWIDEASAKKQIYWKVSDTDNKFHLTRQDANITAFKIEMPLEVVGNINITGNLNVTGCIQYNCTQPSGCITLGVCI